MKRQSNAAPIPSEYQEQAAVIEWWSAYAPTKGIDVRLLMSIPNGSFLAGDAQKRGIQMRRLKATGLRVGVPDLLLAVTRPYFSGLWMEMKRRDGKPSPDQVEMIDLLRRQDYNAVICLGANEAIRAIRAYLDPLPRERI